MKKQIVTTIVLAGLIVGSTNAFASRARNMVMGSGDASGSILNSSGSMSYDSMYNMFYNPAYVNDFKNWAIVEKRGTTNTNEGGFVTSMMNFNLGVFMNRTDAFNLSGAPTLTGAVNAAPGLASGQVRPIDFVFGGDMGVKWGLGVTYANQKAGSLLANTKESNLTVRAGVSVADFDPFISWRFAGTKENNSTATKLENKTKDATVGLRYHYGEWTPYAAYRFGKVEESGSTTVSGERVKNTSMLIGAGRETKLGESARLIYSVSYAKVKYSDAKTNTGNLVSGSATRAVLPIDLSIEGDLSSWFTIRAGLVYRLLDRTSGTIANTIFAATSAAVGSQADTTTARIGATIHANKFDFDWAFGSAGANPDTASFGFDNGTFTAASLSYKW